MRIGLLLPSLLAAKASLKDRIFAPLYPAVLLADGLVEKGHQVYFYSAPDVETKATVVGGNEAYLSKNLSYYQMRDRDEMKKQYTEIEIKKRDFENALTMQAYQDAKEGKLDIIHSYHDFVAHYFNELTGFPTVYTLHNPLPESTDTIEYERFALFKHHNYVSISSNQQKSVLDMHFSANIYHGTDVDGFTFYEHASDEHLVYMGRLIPDKGAAIALQVAKQLDKPMEVATSPNPSNRNQQYFDFEITPLLDEKRKLVDGMLDTKGKAAFWGKGKAFVFPLQWEEPFGLAITEAMAAGTPVIAYARGSAPELIVDGKTGFLVNESENDKRGNWVVQKTGVEGLKEAVEKIYAMSEGEYKQLRFAARKHVEQSFSAKKMVEEYENLYKKILEK